MTGPGEQPKYTKAEKVLNVAADCIIKAFSGLAWVIRKIKPPNWAKK